MILLVSGMMIVVMKHAAISAKHTADSYVKEQSELFLASLIEQTLFAISTYDRSGGSCLKSFDGEKTIHAKKYRAHVEVEKYYMYDENCSNVPVQKIATPESHGYAMLRIEVNASIDGKPVSRIIRRSLQRP